MIHPSAAVSQPAPPVLASLAAGLLLTIAAAAGADDSKDWRTRLRHVGDFRVRHEANSTREGAPDQHRGVLRFRLDGRYRITPALEVGARLVTGYRSHTVRAAYGLLDNTTLSWTWYYFRQLYGEPSEYRSRVRLDLMVRF
jgi:hypothetical protein